MSSPITSPSFDLSGKTALITGAGRGIGLAAAQTLAAAGASVTLLARTESEIAANVKALTDLGLKASFAAMDVTDIERTANYISRQDPFNILVNNAGTNVPASVLEVNPEDYSKIMDVNIKATFFTAQAVVRKLVEAKMPGSIINISSQMGHVGSPNRSIYCASKHAVEGLTKAMGIELGPQGIRVNTICPTFIETPMTKDFLKDDVFRKSVIDKIKLGRIGNVNDITGAILYLASDASSLVTATSLKIDGGWTAG